MSRYINGEDSRKWWIHYDHQAQRWHVHSPIMFGGTPNRIAPGTMDARDFGEAVCHMLVNDPRVSQARWNVALRGLVDFIPAEHIEPPF